MSRVSLPGLREEKGRWRRSQVTQVLKDEWSGPSSILVF